MARATPIQIAFERAFDAFRHEWINRFISDKKAEYQHYVAFIERREKLHKSLRLVPNLEYQQAVKKAGSVQMYFMFEKIREGHIGINTGLGDAGNARLDALIVRNVKKINNLFDTPRDPTVRFNGVNSSINFKGCKVSITVTQMGVLPEVSYGGKFGNNY